MPQVLPLSRMSISSSVPVIVHVLRRDSGDICVRSVKHLSEFADCDAPKALLTHLSTSPLDAILYQ